MPAPLLLLGVSQLLLAPPSPRFFQLLSSIQITLNRIRQGGSSSLTQTGENGRKSVRGRPRALLWLSFECQQPAQYHRENTRKKTTTLDKKQRQQKSERWPKAKTEADLTTSPSRNGCGIIEGQNEGWEPSRYCKKFHAENMQR